MNTDITEGIKNQSSEQEEDLLEEADDSPSLSDYICHWCRANLLDLGIEQADHYRKERRWYQCPKCLRLSSVALGPARDPTPKTDLGKWKREQDILAAREKKMAMRRK
jgi:hypothetical protein